MNDLDLLRQFHNPLCLKNLDAQKETTNLSYD